MTSQEADKLVRQLPASKPELPTHESKEDDVPADLETILASTDKLLAISRGLADTDDRDSMVFRRVHTVADLLNERIQLDADKILRTTLRRLGKQRSLKGIQSNHFGSYASGLIVGHPLSSPLEEINPMHLAEQARRITALGPGGIPSTDSVTEEAQNVNPSQFGFLSAIETPESEKAGVDLRQAWDTKLGTDGRIYQKMLNRRTNQAEWISPADLSDKVLGLPE